MCEYINGHDLIKRLNITDHEFVNQYIIKKGLQPYSLSYKPVPTPPIKKFIFRIKHERRQIEEFETIIEALDVKKKTIEEDLERLRKRISVADIIHNNNNCTNIIGERNNECILTGQEIRINKTEIEIRKNRISTMEDEIERRGGFSWKDYQLPDSNQETREIFDELLDCLYNEDDFKLLTKGIRAKVVKKDMLCQIHRKKCRDVAEKLWAKDPAMTISNMFYNDEINKVFDGKTYADSTIRNWIKDLCPNRRPGRRKKDK
jgi:hypothetical protein